MRGHGKKQNRRLNGTSQTEGIALVWVLLSEPQKHPDYGSWGARVSVQVADMARRELIIEFPFPTDKNGEELPTPQKASFKPAEIDAAITLAVEAGWDPGSRGKAFAFKMPTSR